MDDFLFVAWASHVPIKPTTIIMRGIRGGDVHVFY